MKPVTLDEITRYREAVNDNYSSPDYVIEGLPLGLVGSTIAAGASGKSFFCMQQGLAIAIGRNQKRGKVLFLAAEDPKEQFSERLQSIHNAWGVNDEEMDLAHQNFWPIPLLAKEADIVEKLEGAEAYEFISFLKDLYQNIVNVSENGDNLRLIIFDTFRRFHFLDENDGGAMSRVLSVMEQICHEFKCCCMFIHHINKSSALNNNSDVQQAARGSSVLSDNIRYQQFLSPMSKEESEKYARSKTPKVAIGEDGRRFYVRFGVSKQNYGSPIADVWYERSRDSGVLMPADIVKKTEGK